MSLALSLIRRPYVELDFTRMVFDTRVSFSRSSTAARFKPDKLIEVVASGVPRIDHDPLTGAVRGLLLEEQRTNLLTHSQSIDNAAWPRTNSSVVADDTVAPDGTATADKVVSAAPNGVAYVRRDMTFTATNHTASFYVKAAGSSWCAIRIQNGSTNPEVRFKITDGSASVSQGTAVAYGAVNVGSGWWRCWVTASCTATAGWSGVYVYSSTGQRVYTSSGETIYAWGAQCEAASDASSYIPTTTAAVTRAEDVASFTIPARVVRLVTIYYDGTTSTETVTPGATYTIPTGTKPILRIRGYYA